MIEKKKKQKSLVQNPFHKGPVQYKSPFKKGPIRHKEPNVTRKPPFHRTQFSIKAHFRRAQLDTRSPMSLENPKNYIFGET